MEVSSHSSQLPLVKRFLYEVSLFLGPISVTSSDQRAFKNGAFSAPTVTFTSLLQSLLQDL